MSELATVLQELRLIKSQQAAIIRMLKPEVKPHLVKVGAVVKATGWNREMLRKARELKWVAGYGHGIDTQDKGAGKATTYALKYTLLYLFLVPTGKIDDADNDHSDEKEIPGLNPQWEETLKTCKTKADVLHLYNQNKAAVNSDKRLQELFKTYQNKLK